MSDASEPEDIIPLETAREHLLHWWREPIAGALALGAGLFDTWHYGRDGGLTASLDEALVVGGLILIAGTQRFIGRPLGGNGNKSP